MIWDAVVRTGEERLILAWRDELNRPEGTR